MPLYTCTCTTVYQSAHVSFHDYLCMVWADAVIKARKSSTKVQKYNILVQFQQHVYKNYDNN